MASLLLVGAWACHCQCMVIESAPWLVGALCASGVRGASWAGKVEDVVDAAGGGR